VHFALVVTICIAATSGEEGWVLSTLVVNVGIFRRTEIGPLAWMMMITTRRLVGWKDGTRRNGRWKGGGGKMMMTMTLMILVALAQIIDEVYEKERNGSFCLDDDDDDEKACQMEVWDV
jgi:hypothetical protein